MTEVLADQAPDTPDAPRPAVVTDKPALEGLEAKWAEQWKSDATYAFDRTQPRDNVYSIDPPPPTVSGKPHVGPAFSSTPPPLQSEEPGLGKEWVSPVRSGWSPSK